MPCSFSFIRTSTSMTMALRPCSIHFCRAPKTLLKLSSLSLLGVKYQAVGFRSLSLHHYHLPCHLRRFNGLVTCSGAATRIRRLDWIAVSLPYLEQQTSNYGRYAYQDMSSDESDCEFGSTQQQMSGSTLDNIDEWRWRLTMLIRNKDTQEVVSREKKDRRDFEQLSALATRMGLHIHQYAKVVVFSKVPLPNYRSDLDDKRPQRQVILPFGLLREVEAHLKAYLSQKYMNKAHFSDNSVLSLSGGGSITTDEGVYEQKEPVMQNNVVRERILRRRSLQLREKQLDWQVLYNN